MNQEDALHQLISTFKTSEASRGEKVSDYIKPNPKQAEGLRLIGSGKTIFYGGARGGGKTWYAIAGAFLASRKIQNLRTVIIRETYAELRDNFIDKFAVLFPPEVFKYKYREKSKSIIFKTTGSIIRFESIQYLKDVNKVQGVEYQLMIIDEANNLPLQILKSLPGSLRNPNEHLNHFKPTLIMTGNPGGLNDTWFKTHFVDVDYSEWDEGELAYKEDYVFIQAFYYDNELVKDEYKKRLDQLEGHLRRAWRDGEWNVFQGQFFSEFNHDRHVVDSFPIPEHWTTRFCGLDLGFSKRHPTVCLWLAQNPLTFEIYIYNEFTGEPALSPQVYASQIRTWSDEDKQTPLIYADPSMWYKTHFTTDQDLPPSSLMEGETLTLLPANNERINGWRILKQWLHYDADNIPLLKFFSTLNKTLQTIPALKYEQGRDGFTEDCNTRGADDYADALRYVLVSGFFYPTLQERHERNKIVAKYRELGFDDLRILEEIHDIESRDKKNVKHSQTNYAAY